MEVVITLAKIYPTKIADSKGLFQGQVFQVYERWFGQTRSRTALLTPGNKAGIVNGKFCLGQ